MSQPTADQGSNNGTLASHCCGTLIASCTRWIVFNDHTKAIYTRRKGNQGWSEGSDARQRLLIGSSDTRSYFVALHQGGRGHGVTRLLGLVSSKNQTTFGPTGGTRTDSTSHNGDVCSHDKGVEYDVQASSGIGF